MNTLFSNNESSSNNQTEQAEELSSEASLALLVGDGKKYANTGELAKAMVHSQNHITTLETEATTLREGQQRQAGVDEILAAIKSKGNNEQQPADNLTPADQQVPDTGKPLDITQQIKTALEQNDQLKSAQANVASVTASLQKALGDRANEVYTAVGNSMPGLDLDELAKTSPEAVIRLCTGQQQVVQQTGQTLQTQHLHNQQVIVTDSSAMNLEQLKVHAAEVKMPREERFKLEMANALKQGDSFFDKTK